MSFFAELKRRNVFRVGIFYVVCAWLVVQVAETVLPLFDVPTGVLRGLVLLLGLAFVPVLVFAWIYELRPDGLRRDTGPERTPAPERASRKLDLATLAVAALAIALLVADRVIPTAPRNGAADPSSASQTAAAKAAIRDASIAVLPFADLSADGDQAYFSDGMAEEILNALARVDSLEVASRTSAFAFRGQETIGIPAIAETLHVRHVLEGSVRRAGNTIRITAQLIDAQVDRHLWSETYDRPLTAENLFAIQEEIATAIVAALTESLDLPSTGHVGMSASTDDLAAYDLYLRARAHFQARNSLDTAEELLVRAIAADPGFAQAWALRSALQSLLRDYGYSDLPQDKLDQRGIEFAQRALDIDPDNGIALATLAHIRSRATSNLRARGDLVGIIADLRRAVALDPQYSSAYNWLGLALGHVGFTEEALAVFQRCRQVDPLFAPCAENEYDALFVLGRFDEAYARFLAALERGTVVDEYVNFALLARFGERTAFLFAANQHLWLPGWRRQKALYEAYRNLDADHSALVGELLAFTNLSKGASVAPLVNLLIPIGAYDLLPFPLLMWGPDYARYRQSPQFERFVRESGAFNYWQKAGYPPQCRPVGADGFACD